MNRSIIVVGAGASGLAAAICAARAGASVTVSERMEKPAKKLLATGNGRCNFTNQLMNVSCYRGGDPDFISEVIGRFGTDEILEFFRGIGVEPRCRDGYYYPYSMQASAVASALITEAKQLGVKIICGESVLHIVRMKRGFRVQTDRGTRTADAVILASGGCAAPKFGSDGSGFALARELGLRVTRLVPALCGLRCRGKFWRQIAGVRVQAGVAVYDVRGDGRLLASDSGEVQLTDEGISGIPVFQVSRFAAMALSEGHAVEAVLDLMPEFSDKNLLQMLCGRFERLIGRTSEECLVGLMPFKLIRLLLKFADMDPDGPAAGVPPSKIGKLAEVIKHFRVSVAAANAFDRAQVCAGGVGTEQMDARTMMCRRIPGLFIAGEMLDVDGICGGYNLHFAWASGMIAGTSAAEGTWM